MENEEIRGLMHKKASEDQFMAFGQFSFGALSLFHSWTLRVSLDHFGIGARKSKKERGSKDQVGKGRIKRLQQASLQVSTCMCIFLARFGMHGIACVSFLPWNGSFQV